MRAYICKKKSKCPDKLEAKGVKLCTRDNKKLCKHRTTFSVSWEENKDDQ